MLDSPDLAPDLEWVLLSDQADTALVLEALLNAFYKPVWQIARALEPSTQQEAPFVRQAFVRAVNSRYRYRMGMDIAQWFYGAALETLPASIRRSAWPPLVVVLHVFAGLKATQIAELLKIPAKKVAGLIKTLERAPAATLERLGWEVDDAFAERLNAAWRTALLERFPSPDTNEAQLEILAGEIASQAEQYRRRQKRFLAIGELLLVGLVILLVAGLILAGNRLIPSNDPTFTPVTRVVITQLITRIITVTPIP